MKISLKNYILLKSSIIGIKTIKMILFFFEQLRLRIQCMGSISPLLPFN